MIFGRKNILAGPIKEFFAWRRVLVARVLASALPVTVNETMWSLGMATYNAFYGRMGVTEYAAIQASNTINQLFILAIFSLGDALLILVGQRIGRGDGLCLRAGKAAAWDRYQNRINFWKPSVYHFPLHRVSLQFHG